MIDIKMRLHSFYELQKMLIICSDKQVQPILILTPITQSFTNMETIRIQARRSERLHTTMYQSRSVGQSREGLQL